MFSLAFIFPLLHFMEPGVLWPELAFLHPMQIVGGLALLTSLPKPSVFSRAEAFRHPAFKWFAAFIVVQALSMYRSGVGSMVSELLDWSHIPQYVIVSLILIRDEETLEKYVKGTILGCLWIIGYGVYAYHNDMRAKFGGLAGAYGMYENHNDYSFIIIQALPFIYFMRKWGGGLWRFTMTIAGMTAVYGIILSSSRGAMIALVIECALIIMYGTSRRARRILLPGVLLMGLAGIGYQYHRRAEISGDHYTAADSESSRYELWHSGVNMVLDHPVLGVGSRRFAEYSRQYYELSHDQWGKNSHNTFIEVVATSGLVGLFCFLMMLRKANDELHEAPAPRPEPEDTDAEGIDAEGMDADPSGSEGSDELLATVALAGRISLYSILPRAFFDAKPHDWSLYFLLTMAITVGMLRRAAENAGPAPEISAILEGHPG